MSQVPGTGHGTRAPARSSPLRSRSLRRRHVLLAAVLLAATAGCQTSNDTTAASLSTTAASTTTDPTAAPTGHVATAKPVPSAGCRGGAAQPVSLERRTLPGTDRWYLVTVPTPSDAKAAAPMPMVLDFHGLFEGADLHARTSGLGPYAEQHSFIAVLPNGTGSPVHWDGGVDRTANQDLVFIDHLLDQLETDLCVDTSRVYATGFSNGAILSSAIACAMTDRFAAVAPVAGLTDPPRCRPARPVPVLAFHGTLDPILLFNGGVGGRLRSVLGGGQPNDTPLPEADLNGPGYPANAAAWASRNGCDDHATDRNLTPSVIERTWACPSGAQVLFEIQVGAGHSWPSSQFTKSIEAIVGPTDMSIDATDMMWHFFQRFALPAG